MKRVIILGLFMSLLSFAASAQINVENTPNTPTDTADGVRDHYPVYYRTKGSLALHINNYLVNQTGIVSLPVMVGVDATAAKNFTIGPVFTYFQMKNTSKINEQTTQIRDADMKYHQFIVGVKGSYHLMPFIQSLTKKPMLVDYVDVYISAWGGYSFMFGNNSAADVSFMTKNQRVRGGAALGVRSMVLPRFGFFVEGGYSSAGYASFGLTTVIK